MIVRRRRIASARSRRLVSVGIGALVLALALLISSAAVAAAPVANDDALTVAEETGGAVDVLANDTDPDGDTLRIAAWTQGSNGSVICDGSSCFYGATTPNFHGADSFTYTVSDRPAGSPDASTDTATVNVTVTPVNDPPEAMPDVLTLSGTTSGSIDVLANDTDLENDPLTLDPLGTTDGADGTVSCVAAGTCTYTGGASFDGVDSFTYTVTDGQGGSDVGTVSVCARLSATAPALAAAIETQPGVVTGASYVTTPCGRPNAVSTASLAGFPTASSSFAILTSGNADLADDPNSALDSGADDNGPNFRGNTDFDVTVLEIDLDVPAGRNCLTFDFRFLSEEFPEFVPPQFLFNDAFIAELDSSTWTTSGSEIDAPNNFAFDPSGEVISIRAAGATSMTAAEATGTTYDGATPLLAASTPITPGSHRLFLSIFDQGDRVYDSAVFVDRLVLGTTAPGGCDAGATVLTTAKSADQATSVAGGSNGYSITISNPSGSAVTLNSISDVLPAGFAYVLGSTSGVTSSDPTPAGQVLTWSGPFTVPAGSNVALHFGVTVSSTPGTYFNEASGDAATGAVTPTGPTAMITVTSAPSANLSITKTDSPDPVTVGQSLTYTITVSNALGPDAAQGVVVTDILPVGVSFVSATPSQGTGCSGTTTISCPLGTIAAGGSATVTLVVTPGSPNEALSNTATVGAATADPNTDNNSASATTLVNAVPAPSANLSITKTDSPDPVTVGQSLTYTITVSNALGPDAAQGVVVTDILPVGVSFVSATPSQGTGCSGTTTISCPLGTIAAGGSATVTLVVTPGSPNEALSNTATVGAATADPNTDNNSASATTLVNAAPPTGATCNGHAATFVGGPGRDYFQGGPGVDVVVDLGGHNYLQTGGGDDHVCLGGGNDEVDSGDGNDFVDAGDGKNKVKTGNGADTVRSGIGNDEIATGDGDDEIVDLGGKNKVFTGNDDDRVTSGLGKDEIETGNGDDVVVDAGGNNTVTTGDGDDQITTGAGNDEIDGGNGFDTCSPGTGKDEVKNCEVLPTVLGGRARA